MMNKQMYDLEKLRAISIREVAARFGSVQRQGSHYVAICPWHADKHPSLVLYENEAENRCHCFACGHSGDVIDYVRQCQNLPTGKEGFKEACRWLGVNFGVPVQDKQPVIVENGKTFLPPMVEVTPIAYIPMDYVRKTISVANSLSVCVERLFGREVAERVTRDYMLGIYRNRYHCDATIFWSIDPDGRVHNGKIQRYDIDLNSPGFAHAESFTTPNGGNMKSYWMTNTLSKMGYVPEGSRLDVGGLFGAHLLPSTPIDRQVMIVESPKNAVFGAAAYPEYLWLAAGNKGALNASALECLKGRRGKIYPDRDAIADWTHRKSALLLLDGFTISDFCEKYAPEADAKFDIADYIIARKRQNLIG